MIAIAKPIDNSSLLEAKIIPIAIPSSRTCINWTKSILKADFLSAGLVNGGGSSDYLFCYLGFEIC